MWIICYKKKKKLIKNSYLLKDNDLKNALDQIDPTFIRGVHSKG